MARKTNAAGVRLIENFEALRFIVYQDAVGIPTVGWGHVVLSDDKLKVGDKIGIVRAETFLRADLIKAETAVVALDFPLTDNQFSALVSFTFNSGPTNLGKLVSHGIAAIPSRFALFIYARHKALSGLVRRRVAERRLFLAP